MIVEIPIKAIEFEKHFTTKLKMFKLVTVLSLLVASACALSELLQFGLRWSRISTSLILQARLDGQEELLVAFKLCQDNSDIKCP